MVVNLIDFFLISGCLMGFVDELGDLHRRKCVGLSSKRYRAVSLQRLALADVYAQEHTVYYVLGKKTYQTRRSKRLFFACLSP